MYLQAQSMRDDDEGRFGVISQSLENVFGDCSLFRR
jgi:hypothetical protein